MLISLHKQATTTPKIRAAIQASTDPAWMLAERYGISPSSVGRIWAEAGLKPHLTKSIKVSNDPMFEEKVTDIVGLYLDPPDRDRKSVV